MPRHLLFVLAATVLAACGANGAAGGVVVVTVGTEAPDVAADSASEPGRTVGAIAVTVPPELTTTTVPVVPLEDREETVALPVVPRPADVAVVGDSLTLSASDEIDAELRAAGLDVIAIDAVESRRMMHGGRDLPPGGDAVEAITSVADPGLWVIALGTNDVASVETLEGFRADMAALLALVPVDAPVIWVDLWLRDHADLAASANDIIRDELASRPGGAAIVDWYSFGGDDRVITGDGVHLTDLGQRAFAHAIAGAIDDLFPE